MHRCTQGVLAILFASTALFPAISYAAGDDFNVQVSPSPLVVALRPGEHKVATITVRNLTAHPETLYPSLKGFDIDDKTQAISVKDSLPANLKEWISFKQPSLTLGPGAAAPLDVVYSAPNDVGFSYSLAIVLSRAPSLAANGSVRLQGAVAVFNLINIDRPDAVSSLSIQSLTVSRSMYEFLPATFNVTVKNNGNIIGQPGGTLFIQRSFDDNSPLATIALNPAESYVLPGKSRTFTLSWGAGFPRYVTTKTADNTAPSNTLSWNWKDLNDLRFGRYTAKAVLVYSNGQRDQAVTASTNFWVIPWRLIGGSILLLALIAMGLAASGWLGFKAAKKVKGKVGRRAQ